MKHENELKKIVLLVTIGLCDALQAKILSIDEAEHYLFSPRTMRLMDYDAEIKEIIHLCTEFSNVARLLPNSLDDAIADVKHRALVALKNSSQCDYQSEPWLNRLV